MQLSAQEKATLHFYEWEYRNRGYYHFDTPVNIEAPYIPFYHKKFTDTSFIDDGVAPSFFKGIQNLFLPTKVIEEPVEEELVLEPNFLVFSEKPTIVGFSLSFPKGTEILPNRNIEYLNILSFSEDVISFEIIGTNEDITIQFVSSEFDSERIQSHLKAYFPTVIVKQISLDSFNFDEDKEIAIADFGLNDEFIRPIKQKDSFGIDSLTSLFATMESLQMDDVAVFQILFKGITSPLAKEIPYSVSDGAGGSFFADAPEMVFCAKDKISNPLFSVVLRIAAQGKTMNRSQYLAQELARSISSISSSEFNKLIPLSNEGYDYDFHFYNLNNRLSNRLGFILNSKELNTFVHYPNKTVISSKLGLSGVKTKRAKSILEKGIPIGTNIYNGEEVPVIIDTETRLSHTHILGVTGVGKSTLLANMILADISQGLGCAMFDPHGDIIDDILVRIPEDRAKDVILIDPSDADFPIGFNLLEANTDAEKIVLSSDLVSAFKRHATAWGDNMTAVLQNAVNTVLESSRGGTLIELKRFLIEEKFREEYLTSVKDPSLHYYWKNEYPMVRKGISPLLTRIDTFLRPKLVRYMLAQKKGVDISECLRTNKIVLLKLSQGLIGEQNSYLLGSLFLAKFNQAALARQSKNRNERAPYMLYLDEFQNFITPSIERILSGARKYSLGITIAHQEMGQIQDVSLSNSVLSNPKTRICFRLGDNDAKKLESGFSYFEASDLQGLERGEAIMRIGSSSNDFNLKTAILPEITENFSDAIISSVRINYGTQKAEVEKLLISMLPSFQFPKKTTFKKPIEERPKVLKELRKIPEPKIEQNNVEVFKKENVKVISKKVREQLIQDENTSEEIRTHIYLQSMIKKLGQDRNYKATTEYLTKDGGRIDVVLEQNGLKIGVEISETNKPTYEVQNIKKCLRDGCIPVIVISKNRNHLNAIKNLADKELSKKDRNLVQFIQPDEISNLLDGFAILPQKQQEVIKGFRIVTEFDNNESSQTKNIKSRLAKIFKRKK
jgi:DNA helicase HerA-like ATPase